MAVIDADIPVGRLFTPAQTLTNVVIRARGGQVEVLRPRTLEVLVEIEAAEFTFVCAGPECDDASVLRRYQIVATDGTRFLAEGVVGCGCGGVQVGDALAERLAW
jgi:hypothetical protein